MRTDHLLLEDMFEAIVEVIENTPEERLNFDSNKLLKSHIIRNIQIVGEAAVRLSKEIKEANPQVPWRQIVGMRHAIVHDYFEIDWNVVYDTARHDIPSLKPLIAEMIATSRQNDA